MVWFHGYSRNSWGIVNLLIFGEQRVPYVKGLWLHSRTTRRAAYASNKRIDRLMTNDWQCSAIAISLSSLQEICGSSTIWQVFWHHLRRPAKERVLCGRVCIRFHDAQIYSARKTFDVMCCALLPFTCMVDNTGSQREGRISFLFKIYDEHRTSNKLESIAQQRLRWNAVYQRVHLDKGVQSTSPFSSKLCNAYARQQHAIHVPKFSTFM